MSPEHVLRPCRERGQGRDRDVFDFGAACTASYGLQQVARVGGGRMGDDQELLHRQNRIFEGFGVGTRREPVAFLGSEYTSQVSTHLD